MRNIKMSQDKSESSPLLKQSTSQPQIRYDVPPDDMYAVPSSTVVANGVSTRVTPVQAVAESKPYDPEGSMTVTSVNSKREFTQDPITNMQSLMNLIKGNLGAGIMAMPSAFQSAGLWVGFVGIFVVGLLASHCMHLLVRCSHYLCEKSAVSALDFGQVADMALKTGPRRLRSYNKIAKNTINVFLNITQYGFCCVYVLFISKNIEEFVKQYTDYNPPIQVYEICLTVLLIPLVSLGSLRTLAFFSLVANILSLTSIVIIFQHLIQNLSPADSYPAFNTWAALPLFYGQALFSYESIGVVLPIENKMKNPDDYPGWTGVLTLGMTIVTVLYASMGFFGYLSYGHQDIKGSISLNLPHSGLYSSVKLMYSLAIYISYGLQFYVPTNTILWPVIARRLHSRIYIKYGKHVFRIAIVFITFLLAASIPYLDNFISLVGALCCSTLALIFPPLLHILTFWDVPNGFGPGNWELYKDICISLFGVVGLVSGTYTSIDGIVQCFQNSSAVSC